MHSSDKFRSYKLYLENINIKGGNKYSETQRKQAVHQVTEEGKTCYTASKQSGIPLESLKRWVNNSPSKFGSGKQKTSAPEEEEIIGVELEQAAKCGWPCDRQDVTVKVKSYLDITSSDNVFRNNTPEIEWLRDFEKRWSQRLSRKKIELL